MDLFVLNTDLEVISIADTYSSLIWTDRYNECGDFEICVPMRQEALEYFKQGYYLSRNDSEHIMVIEELMIKSDIEDGDTLIITGRSIESILDRRVVWGQKIITGNLQNGIQTLLNENVISPSNVNRKISNFIFEASTDPVVTGLSIDAQYTGDNLYEVITNVCKETSIGFKVTLDENKRFVFKLYAGVDRSYDQTVNPYVVFSPKFDNLITSNYFESSKELKNVTLVGGEGEGTQRRYTAVGNLIGLNRRELFTDARDISSDISEPLTEMFSFTQYPSQVFNVNTKTFVTDALFNSAMIDVSAYAGRTISLTIPKYTNASGAKSPYATIIVDSSKKYISTLKAWEIYDETANSGTLERYDIKLPDNASYLYTSMYSQKAIDDKVYYGDASDFECIMTVLSNAEYVSLLRQRGKEKLAEYMSVVSFEGEAETTTMFRYGVDFSDGDIVQIADAYGHDIKARILEIVTSESDEGYSVYPTFSLIEENVLPESYLKMNYVQSSGTQYIDTGVKPTTETRVVLELSNVIRKNSNVLFGARDNGVSTSGNAYGALISSDSENLIRSDYFMSMVTTSVDDLAARATIDKNRNIFSAYGTMVENAASTHKTCQYPIYLFCYNNVGVPNFYSSYKLYSCKIYDGDTLVRDFVPCKNDLDVVGLYDLVGEKFYGNLGTGLFVAG